jgi:hypothetical protein
MKYTKLTIALMLLPLMVSNACKKDDPKTDDPNTGPQITATNPNLDALGVTRNVTISAVFNVEMKASTINETNFTVKQGTTAITGIVAYAGKTATFTPAVSLNASAVYTVTITTGVKDLSDVALAANKTWSFTTGGSTSILSPVDLGASGNYVILAKTAINNATTSAITGDIALSPAATSYITGLALVDFTGYATSAQVTVKVYAADMADPTPVTLTTAVGSMITAYNDAAGRNTPDFIELGSGNIGGMTLYKGLYKWTSTVTIPTDLTLAGGANDVFIFQIAGDLTQSAAVNVILTGGLQAKNIFWQVAGEATFLSTSHMEGNILSMTGITFRTGATLKGRALAQTAVILDANTITKL